MAEKGKIVLLVDDVQLFLRLEETFFKRAGCRVLTAQSGREAIKLVQEKMPDLVLLDYYMPDMRGDKVIQALKADAKTKQIPIIIVSTSAKNEDIKACYEAGCADYITKPIQPDTVLARVASLLDISHRIHRRLPVNFRIEGEAPPLTFTGFSRNLSQGGISIEAEQIIENGTRLRLWIPILPKNSMIELCGEVVRSELDKMHAKYLYGVKFIDVSREAQDALIEYLKKHLPEEQIIL